MPLPRLAVGTVQPSADLRPILWALMDALRQQGLQVQSFFSQACFAGYHGEAGVTGLSPRHLDSWLMTPTQCRDILLRSARTSDLAIVEGKYCEALGDKDAPGGRLDALCDWLDLPRVVVLDAAELETCPLPERPEAEALLLDRVADPRHLERLSTSLESQWNIPVMGSLEELASLRKSVDAIVPGCRPPRELCRQLGNHFLRSSRPEQLIELAARRELPWFPPEATLLDPAPLPVVVALAHDDALNCYFPDTLDLLELYGATIVDFSPLRDERLPARTDIVYLGCGHPERYAAALSQNHCMKLALRDHVRKGGRIFAEGGGLAYLCQQLAAPDGELVRMVGLFPAVARPERPGGSPAAVEVTLERETWLGPSGTRLRGYRSPGWRLEPIGALVDCASAAGSEPNYDVVAVSRAVGTRLHLNFAAQPHLLAGFLQPNPAQPSRLVDPWAVAQ